MYTLRTVKRDYTQNNFIGGEFVEVCKEKNRERFNEVYKEVFGDEKQNEDVIKFIITSIRIPIYKDEFSYIVMPNGKTFRCLNNPINNK